MCISKYGIDAFKRGKYWDRKPFLGCYTVYYMFKMSGLYKKAGITDENTKMKVAKIFYYTVVAGLAVAAEIGAVGAFKAAASQAAHGGEFALGTFEGAMAAIKSGEVVEFLGELGISATAAS